MKRVIVKKYFLYLILFLTFSTIFFIIIGIDNVSAESSLRITADAPTYKVLAKQEDIPLISIGGNYLGPVLIYKILNCNEYLVYLFNVSIFLLAFKFVKNTKKYNVKLFAKYIMINPIFFFSLFSVNKEILLLCIITGFYSSDKKRKFLFLCLSILVRWQLTLFLLLDLLINSKFNFLYKYKKSLIFIFVLVISLVFPILQNTFSQVQNSSDIFIKEDIDGSGLVGKLNSLQYKNLGYLIVVWPKIIQNLIGPLIRIRKIFDFSDFYNNFIMMANAFCNLIMLILFILKRKIDIENELFFSMIIFSIIFGLSTFIQPRYFLPIYVLMALILSEKGKKNNEKLISSCSCL